MKKLSILLALLIFCSESVLADPLEIELNVKQGEKPVEIVGADVYANIEGNLTEITVSPDKLPFKWNFKAGALRIKSFWATEKQFKNNNSSVPVSK